MSALDKNLVYNAQGDVVPPQAPTASGIGVISTTWHPASHPTTATHATVTTTPISTSSESITTPYPYGLTNSTTLVGDDEDSGWKVKVSRVCTKIGTAFRHRFESCTKPRSDPLGGYTVKGPGYYEKKHRFTRRVTTRGTPPSSFTPDSPAYISSTTPSSFPSSFPSYPPAPYPLSTVRAPYRTPSSAPLSSSSGPGAYSSNIPSSRPIPSLSPSGPAYSNSNVLAPSLNSSSTPFSSIPPPSIPSYTTPSVPQSSRAAAPVPLPPSYATPSVPVS